MSDSLPLHTIVDPAFGLLGAFLLLIGLPLAFIGHRSQWYTCASTGFFSLSLVILAFILRFGQARAIAEPSWTTRGLFLLASLCGGLVGALFAIIFRQGALLLTNALGGFALALFLQACKVNGLIESIEMRFILYIVVLTIFFIAGCFPRIHYFAQIISTSFIGTTAAVLGIDCFTRAGLKEFYVRNLGFDDLFAKRYPDTFESHRFPMATGMVIELGVLGGVTCMAIALQGKLWVKLKESMLLMRQQDAERQAGEERATGVAKRIYCRAQKDLRRWRSNNGEEVSVQAGEMSELNECATVTSDKPPKLDFVRSEKSFENALRSSIALSLSQPPLSETPPSSKLTAPANRSGSMDDKVKLLEEIAAIRRSICELRGMAKAKDEERIDFPTRPSVSSGSPTHMRRWSMFDSASALPSRPLLITSSDLSHANEDLSTVPTPSAPHAIPSPVHHAPCHSALEWAAREPTPTHSPRPRRLTMEELQSRHSRRLSQIQRPLSMQLNEVAALERAKEEWEVRKAQERRYWQQKHRPHHHRK